MEDDDQAQSCFSNGSNNGRSSSSSFKKPKQRKVPQRGLGVAQLEKIRLEEQQQKRDHQNSTAISQSPPCSVIIVSSSSSSTKSSYLPFPANYFHPSSTTTNPFPLPLQYMDVKLPSTVPLGGFEANWPSVSVSGNFPKLWNSQEFDNFDKDNNNTFGGVEPGLPFLPNLSFESNSIWSLPNWGQKPPHYHHQSPMVNISAGTSSTPVPHFSIEPPSNQNYNCNGVPAKLEEKQIVVGMKRPYPFSLDIPNAPAFNYKLPTLAELSANARSTTFESGSGFNFENVGNSTSREVPSCSASNSEPNLKKTNKGCSSKHLDGHFLTLATPTTASIPPSQFNSSASFQFYNQVCPEFESPTLQGNAEDQLAIPPGYRLYHQQKQPLLNSFFLPAAKEAQTGQQSTARIQNFQEIGENIDLNLKL